MFEFILSTHEYFLNGKKLTAVSDLIRPLSNTDENDEYLINALDGAAERGVTCHAVIESLLCGRNVDGEYPDAYEPYIDAVRLFLSEHDISPLYMESPLYSEPLMLAGTPDLICLFDGESAIVDYKFVAQVDKPKVKAQLNAYRLICLENGIDIDELYAVQFLDNGCYRLYPVAVDCHEIDLLLEFRERKNKKHPRGRIE